MTDSTYDTVMAQRVKVPDWPDELATFATYLAAHGVSHGLSVRALDNATRSFHAERLAFANAHHMYIDGHLGGMYSRG